MKPLADPDVPEDEDPVVPPVVVPLEQAVANWFASRLASITTAAGYSMTIAANRIFVDGDPTAEENPRVPFAEYDDNQGSWSDVATAGVPQSGFLGFQPAVKVTVKAKNSEYKRIARLVFDDVVRACAQVQWAADDKPEGVVSILPDSWAREERDGSYLEVAVVFTVKLASSMGRR